jgi:uncharacterized delta-60 repeat protein
MIVVCATFAARSALGAAGDLDPSFGSGGTTVSQFGPQEDRASAGALQPDGKIVVGGGSFASGAFRFGVQRYQSNGTLDPSFGTGGTVVTTLPANAEITSIIVQPDGKIIAGGYVYTTAYDIALVRYQSNGALDPTFGTGGVMISPIGPGRGFPRRALLQGDGKIVVTGENDSASGAFTAARFKTDGSVDASFGVGGEVSTLVGSFDIPFGALLQPDGKIVLAGSANFTFTLVRYDTNGVLDPTFGTGGIATGVAVPGTYTYDVDRQADGKFVVSGTSHNGTNYRFSVTRFEANGAIDTGFGTGGVVHSTLGTGDAFPYAILAQPNGRVIAAGDSHSGFPRNFTLAGYTPGGVPDPGFGTGGVVTTSFGLGFSTVNKLLQQPDGRVVAVGQSFGFTAGSHGYTLARYFAGVCGNGATEPGEQCDDGNTASGDCCSATCQFEPAGGACTDDADACTIDQCDGAGACAHESVTCGLCQACDSAIGCHDGPLTGCLAPGALGKSSLLVKDRAIPTSDIEKWQWRSGTVSVGDFGDPLTDDYALCVFSGPTSALWRKHLIPAGGICGSRPCWRTSGTPAFVAKYADPGGTPDGITGLVLRSRVPGHAQIKLKGRGPSLALPSLATLALPVRVQLQRTGACWEATYATPRVSTSEVFQAK